MTLLKCTMTSQIIKYYTIKELNVFKACLHEMCSHSDEHSTSQCTVYAEIETMSQRGVSMNNSSHMVL